MKAILFISLVLLSVNIYAQVQSQEFDRFDFKKGFTLGGTFNATSIAYTASGESRRDPFDYYLTGGLNVGIFGYSVPFSFNYSNRKTNYTQPFNNFKFNPSYKWARAYFGTTSMTFSDYTLSGHLFSGVGVELTPGKWEIAAMYGKLQSAVEPSRDQPTQGEAAYKPSRL